MAKRTISAADYLADTEKNTAEICDCQSDDCVKAQIKKRINSSSPHLFVSDDPTLAGPIADAERRGCQCLRDALKRGVQVEVSSVKINLSVHFTCN